MARSRNNGNGRLEEALVALIQNQAALLTRVAETDRELVMLERQHIELERITSERFARIERILAEHSEVLAEHTRILHDLPDLIRDRFGFRAPEAPKQ